MLVAVVCTGCQLRLALDVDVNRNGGGTLAFAVGADAELLERARDAGADPLGDLADTGKALDDGWRVTDVSQDTGARTVTLATDFAGPDDLARISQELTEALAAPEVVLLERLEVDVTDDRIDVAGTAGAVLKPAVRAYGLTPRKAARLLRRTDALEYRVSITPPGEVVETNAPSGDASDASQAAGAGRGSALVWTIPPGRSIDFAVTSTRPGPSIVAIVLGVIAAVVVAWVVVRIVIVRRRRASRRRPSAG